MCLRANLLVDYQLGFIRNASLSADNEVPAGFCPGGSGKIFLIEMVYLDDYIC